MNDELESAGLEAVDKFLRTFNSRDVNAWAGSLNFPHVRPAPFGKINTFESEKQYTEALGYDRIIATGWDHSEWDYKHVIHVSQNKIHVAGQWSRFTAGGDKLLTTPIVYIVTRHEDNWGIQSRFSADYVDDESDDGATTEMETRGFALVHDFINLTNEGNKAACAELINYPHFEIGEGNLKRSDHERELHLPEGLVTVNSLYAIQTGVHSMNAALDINIAGAGTPVQRQAVLNINNRENHLGIQAWSILDPTLETHA